MRTPASRLRPYGIACFGLLTMTLAIALLAEPEPDFIPFDPPGSMITDITEAWAINDAGLIVGTSIDSAQNAHGYLRTQTNSFSPIAFPSAGPHGTSARGINNPGDIVGFYLDVQTISHGYLFSKGVFTTVDCPNALLQPGSGTAPDNAAFSINDVGEIVGQCLRADGPNNTPRFHGFRVNKNDVGDPSKFRVFDVPNSTRTLVRGINDKGDMVGRFDDSHGTHGFFWASGAQSPATVDFAGAKSTVVAAVIEDGSTVGAYVDSKNVRRGFVSEPHAGPLKPFDAPSAKSTTPSGMNSRHNVVGFFVDATNKTHGFWSRKAKLP
jgi:hypothetical protein